MKKSTVLILSLDVLLALFVGIKTQWFTYLNGELSFGGSLWMVLLLFSPSIFIGLKTIAKKWEANILKKQ